MRTILTTTGISLFMSAGRKYNTKAPTDDQMRQHLRMEPKSASAEANSLLQIAQPDDHIVLLHTDTPEARKCAELLGDLFDKLIYEVEKAQRKEHEVVINATAGFKAQVVYSTMIGMLYHVPVKYIYEKFQRIVPFNPMALDWDTSILLNHNKFFQWLDDEPRSQQEVEKRLKGLPDQESIEALLTLP